ncbi:MAG: hypothetical protein HY979_03045 [Candidatus Magasanikbacteria bacterium]|nr:hypothetical protein [Candidatus Magasanikbacteria bacterium]
MGFFTSKKIFNTRQQIKDALFKLKTIDYREKPNVYEALIKELDDGGVTSEEMKRVIRELREHNEISEIDKKYLLEIIGE